MKTPITPAALNAAFSGNIDNFIAATTPGGIEAQEKNGQIEQSFAETLPKDGTTGKDRTKWESLGFVFGTDSDDIFINVTFPKGWRKKPTDHSMWSELLDNKGHKRGAIFYKAAFYDRSAHIHLEQRFSVSCYEPSISDAERSIVIKDADKIIHTIGVWAMGDYPTLDSLQKVAEKWLADNYPDWNDVSAYWD